MAAATVLLAVLTCFGSGALFGKYYYHDSSISNGKSGSARQQQPTVDPPTKASSEDSAERSFVFESLPFGRNNAETHQLFNNTYCVVVDPFSSAAQGVADAVVVAVGEVQHYTFCLEQQCDDYCDV